MEMVTHVIPTADDVEHEVRNFLQTLEPRTEGATLVTLSGELGAGKTTFTQAVAKALGIEDVVNSPTFVIEKIYSMPGGKNFARLVHIDAYRLTSAAELDTLGFDELMNHAANLIVLEWPENVAGVDGRAAVKIRLEPQPDGSRQITYA